MTRADRPNRGGGLSLTTLLLASLSSGTAALIVSRVWEDGTVVSAAVTPVLVALLSEALRRPTERLSEAARPLAGAARPRVGRRPPAAEDVPRFGAEGPPPRVYGGRNVRLQAVLITAVLAFVMAAAALTLPELLLGRSVASGEERTTYFGGTAQPRAGSEGDEQGQDETGAETSTTTTTTTTTTETAPTATEPGSPAPAPTEPVPPGGGEPAPPATTAPAPAPGQK